MISITDLRCIVCAPEGIDLVVVVVETSEPGLTGYGCATFTQRASAVAETVTRYLAPLITGRDATRIEDLWRLAMASSYWRGGPVTNAAIGGVDMALWDILGKRAGMPLYELLGGLARDRVDVYRHADGPDIDRLVERVQELSEQGHRYIRCQLGGYGGAGAMSRSGNAASSLSSSDDDRRANHGDVPIDPARYMRATIAALEAVRSAVGEEVELLHDVHERVPPREIARFSAALDQIGLFFLEDPLSPDQADWLTRVRAASTTPIAIGELFTTPEQWSHLIRQRLFDFIRVHVSHIGGITPALKLAAVCEASGVQTAWHGPGDCSPLGHAANLHLDFSQPNFGIQEYYEPKPIMYELFDGMPRVVDGAIEPPTRPGLGISFDESELERFPPGLTPPVWTRTRLSDGTAIWP